MHTKVVKPNLTLVIWDTFHNFTEPWQASNMSHTKLAYPKVAGEEFRTSGGTYAAVPTKLQAFSSAETKIEKLISGCKFKNFNSETIIR